MRLTEYFGRKRRAITDTPIVRILKRSVANRDAATEAYIRKAYPDVPMHVAFLPTIEEQDTAREYKRERRRQARRSRVQRRRRMRQPDRCNLPRRPGPLEAAYDSTTLPPRLKAAGRVAQLIVKMKPLYMAGNRRAFNSLVPEFDWLCDLLEGDGWGATCRLRLWPRFCTN